MEGVWAAVDGAKVGEVTSDIFVLCVGISRLGSVDIDMVVVCCWYGIVHVKGDSDQLRGF